MTTNDYVKKYKLSVSDKFNHSDFVQDLSNDFIALLEINKANDNLKGFDNALRCIRMKFDSISNKTAGVLYEKLWGYFFATVVVKLREELCPKDMEKRRKLQEEQKKEWERRKAQRDFENQEFSEYFWGRDFFSFLFSSQSVEKPIDSFSILGLNENATELDVKSAFKKLANIHHPDKGGKQDKFIEITESKNKCLRYLESIASKQS